MKARKKKVKLIPVWIDRIAGGAPRVRTALRWTLLASLVIHVSFAPVVPQSSKVSSEDLKRYESDYQKKVAAAKNAKVVAHVALGG